MRRGPPRSTLFPYTPLFRSRRVGDRLLVPPRLELVAERVQVGVRPDAGVAEQVPGAARRLAGLQDREALRDRKSTRLNSSHANISYAVFCLKKKTNPARSDR